jgi:hypothetical protein
VYPYSHLEGGGISFGSIIFFTNIVAIYYNGKTIRVGRATLYDTKKQRHGNMPSKGGTLPQRRQECEKGGQAFWGLNL